MNVGFQNRKKSTGTAKAMRKLRYTRVAFRQPCGHVDASQLQGSGCLVNPASRPRCWAGPSPGHHGGRRVNEPTESRCPGPFEILVGCCN